MEQNIFFPAELIANWENFPLFSNERSIGVCAPQSTVKAGDTILAIDGDDLKLYKVKCQDENLMLWNFGSEYTPLPKSENYSRLIRVNP